MFEPNAHLSNIIQLYETAQMYETAQNCLSESIVALDLSDTGFWPGLLIVTFAA